MEMLNDHPSLDLIEYYLLSRVTLAEAHKIEAHLLLCDTCREMTEALDHEIELIRLAA